MLIDTHAHLDFDEYKYDVRGVIARAYDEGVGHILTVGVNLETSQKCIELAHSYSNVYAAVGIHPHEASQVKPREVIKAIEDYIREEKVVALGEVGLDYYRGLSKPADQKKLLREFLHLQKKCNLPLILHARDSYNDLFVLLRKELKNTVINGVLHCFSGSERDLENALRLGLYISFTGPLTYKNNDELRALVAHVPDDRLLLETDCPYLAPQSQRGKRNEPAFLCETAVCIAEVRGISVEDLGRITTINCNTLFGFPDIDFIPRVVYKIRDSLYINTTKECTNECTFCVRFFENFVKGHNLRIDRDPDVAAILKEIESFGTGFKEVVFCGFGEPLIRLDFVKDVSRALKEKNIYIRVDTNGHGNLIHKRNILPEVAGLVDELSISLNAPNASTYRAICRPHFEGNVYQEVVNFVREAKKHIPHVAITYLDLPGIEHHEMERIAEELGVGVRCRHYNKIG